MIAATTTRSVETGRTLAALGFGCLLLSGTEGLAATKVDFSHAFAPPHRLTVCLPDSSDKTIINCLPDRLWVGWTYENLIGAPIAAYQPVISKWGVTLIPSVDGKPLPKYEWKRSEGFLPALDARYSGDDGSVAVEVTGCKSAAAMKISVANTSSVPHRYELKCEGGVGPWPGAPDWTVVNRNWTDRALPADALIAIGNGRSNRLLVAALGNMTCEALRSGMTLSWNLAPGQSAHAWLIRPYDADAGDLPSLRERDWDHEVDAAKSEWKNLIASAATVSIPDPMVDLAFKACLADIFVMREPVAKGKIAGIPGTEAYRCVNPGEPLIAAISMDQLGMHEQAGEQLEVPVSIQGDNGDWCDPEGWAKDFQAASGFKAWSVMEHFRLTQDRKFLEEAYPRMLASSRFQEKQRAGTRVLADGKRPVTYGLMPRGRGDCGLWDGSDDYGIFLPHNIWTVFADRLTLEAASILNRTADIPELEDIYENANRDLIAALRGGAIREDGFEWIPGVAGKTSGSRWGVLNALFPCRILSAQDPLITGTIRYMEANMSEGGLPLNTGWLKDGLWVAMGLDNLGQAQLERGNGDAFANYLYAVLNHGNPLFTWCEERGKEAGSAICAGDRQHLWTPVAVVRGVRDALIMEDGSGLHLARGSAREWLASGETMGIENADTHFGRISYGIRYDRASGQVTGDAVFPEDSGLEWAVLHVRLPEAKIAKVVAPAGSPVMPDGESIKLIKPRGRVSFVLDLEKSLEKKK